MWQWSLLSGGAWLRYHHGRGWGWYTFGSPWGISRYITCAPPRPCRRRGYYVPPPYCVSVFFLSFFLRRYKTFFSETRPAAPNKTGSRTRRVILYVFPSPTGPANFLENKSEICCLRPRTKRVRRKSVYRGRSKRRDEKRRLCCYRFTHSKFVKNGDGASPAAPVPLPPYGFV